MHNRLSVAQVSKVPDPASWEREQVNMHTQFEKASSVISQIQHQLIAEA